MSTNNIPTKDTSTQPTIPPPSPSSSSSAPQTANPHLLYIALSLNTNLTDDPDPIHWSLLVTPATTSSPIHLLYTYSAHTTTTTPASGNPPANNINPLLLTPIIPPSPRPRTPPTASTT